MKKTIIFLAVILTIFCLAACKPDQPAPKPAPKPAPAPEASPSEARGSKLHPAVVEDRVGTAEDLKVSDAEVSAAKAKLGQGLIGIVPCTMATEYHFQAADSARRTLQRMGFTAQLVDPESKSEKQISALENLTAAGARVIIICVLDPKVLQSALVEAAKREVYIVQYAGRDSVMRGIGISIDDAELGQTAGEFAAKLIKDELGGGAVVAILDYPDLPNAVARADAIVKALADQLPGLVIAGRYLGGTQENGLKSMESALQARPDINVVVSINDAGAYGALQALAAANKDPNKTIIVGIDAEKPALDFIRAGGMYRGSVDTGPAKTGELAAFGAVKLLAGATVPREITVPVRVVTRADLVPAK